MKTKKAKKTIEKQNHPPVERVVQVSQVKKQKAEENGTSLFYIGAAWLAICAIALIIHGFQLMTFHWGQVYYANISLLAGLQYFGSLFAVVFLVFALRESDDKVKK